MEARPGIEPVRTDLTTTPPQNTRSVGLFAKWRPDRESNPGARICSPLRHHSAIGPRKWTAALARRGAGGNGLSYSVRLPTAPLRGTPSQGKSAAMSIPASATLRQTMVDTQLKTVGVTDAAVLAAFAAIPREIFLPAGLAGLAHADAAHEVARGRHLLAPLALALLLQHAAVEPGLRVLVVGSATGYSAAVLACLGAAVTALESDAALIAVAQAAGVTSVCGPLVEGWPAAAPYDLILFEGAIDAVPAAIAAQLAPGGRIAAVLRQSGVGRGYVGAITAAGRAAGLPFIEMAAPDLLGFAQKREFAF